MKTVKLAISELRKNKGVTQRQIADYLGVSFQSISKWEKGITMPDITFLPKLAEYFQVSTDEILGLKSLSNKEYISRETETKEYWNEKLDYLKTSRVDLWNHDYLAFLVKDVWKINRPVSIVDFGCGYGYLGMMLLPILPKGSTYTGIDISNTLINEAKTYFSNTKYITEFIECDIYSYKVKNKYDIAICQTLLRDLSRPKEALKKMIDSVSIGGLVICIEVNRELDNAGLYIEGMNYESICVTPIYQRFWNAELKSGERDYSIGIRIPYFMQEYGLRDIDIRIHDKVKLMNPYADKNKYYELYNAYIAERKWDEEYTDDKKEAIISLFMNRGLSRAEAEEYLKSQCEIRNYLTHNRDSSFFLKTLGLLITYGRK